MLYRSAMGSAFGLSTCGVSRTRSISSNSYPMPASWTTGGYSPVTPAEVQATARDLRAVIQPKGVLFAEDRALLQRGSHVGARARRVGRRGARNTGPGTFRGIRPSLFQCIRNLPVPIERGVQRHRKAWNCRAWRRPTARVLWLAQVFNAGRSGRRPRQRSAGGTWIRRDQRRWRAYVGLCPVRISTPLYDVPQVALARVLGLAERTVAPPDRPLVAISRHVHGRRRMP